MPLLQGKYAPEQREKNRINVISATVIGVGAIIGVAVYRSWTLAQTSFFIGLWLFLTAWAYWVFASNGSGPIDTTDASKKELRDTPWGSWGSSPWGER